jgi:hypothetical protein
LLELTQSSVGNKLGFVDVRRMTSAAKPFPNRMFDKDKIEDLKEIAPARRRSR